MDYEVLVEYGPAGLLSLAAVSLAHAACFDQTLSLAVATLERNV